MALSVLLKSSFSLFLKILIAGTFSTVATINERPIIGVLTEQVYGENRSVIVASYVKFLESAGARVIPVLSNSSQEQLTSIFNSINGVLFPGGGVNLHTSQYGKAGGRIFELAKQANDKGDYFPLWGTCLGFELLNYLQDDGALSSVDAVDVSLPLHFTKDSSSSRMYSSFSSEVLMWLSQEELCYNHHNWGVTVETFNSSPRLNSFYTVLSTSKDKKGIEFISSMEGKSYPFYGVQWHPEKSGFEWSIKEKINHSQHAVIAMQMAANFFVSEARRSNHSFSNLEERLDLIYQYTPTYTGYNTNYEQTYFF